MRVFRVSLFNVFILCSCIAAFAQGPRSEYFAVLPFWEIQLTPFKGAYPISESETRDRIHLKLDYDDQNRVVRASVRLGEQLKAFDGFGNLYINAPLTTVEYKANQEIHHFFDHFGEPTTIMQGTFSKVYEKDELGRNVRLTFQDKKGNEAKDFFGYTRYEWTYEFDGSVIEERYTAEGTLAPLRGDFQFMRTRVIYGIDGYPHLLQNIDESGDLTPTETGATTLKYFYDQQGRFSRWEVYDAEGKPAIGPSDTAGEQNVFDGYDLREIRFFDKAALPVKHWSGAEKWYKEYDQYGNTTKRIFKRANNSLMNGYGGYAQMINEWSEDGRWLLAQYYLDEKGQPVDGPQKGVSKTTYQRDEKGAVLSTTTFGYANGEYFKK